MSCIPPGGDSVAAPGREAGITAAPPARGLRPTPFERIVIDGIPFPALIPPALDVGHAEERVPSIGDTAGEIAPEGLRG